MNEAKFEKFISDNLSETGKKITPPRDLLLKIIEAVGKPAALDSASVIPARRIGTKYFNFSFSQKLFVTTGLSMAIVAVLFLLPANFKSIHHSVSIPPKLGPVFKAQSQEGSAESNLNNQTPTTDDVDAAVTAIVASVSDEDSTLTSDVDDESLSDEDGAAINNLMQNYDQAQF